MPVESRAKVPRECIAAEAAARELRIRQPRELLILPCGGMVVGADCQPAPQRRDLQLEPAVSPRRKSGVPREGSDLHGKSLRCRPAPSAASASVPGAAGPKNATRAPSCANPRAVAVAIVTWRHKSCGARGCHSARTLARHVVGSVPPHARTISTHVVSRTPFSRCGQVLQGNCDTLDHTRLMGSPVSALPPKYRPAAPRRMAIFPKTGH